ncbi:hypothetical protein ABFX02_01G114100 [Erythranthe guttata]
MADLKKDERQTKFVGVRKRNSKYSAEIWDFRKKKRVWLGTFNTPEEASFVYLSMKREIDEYKAKLFAKKIPSQNPSSTLDSPSHVQLSDKNDVSDGTSSRSAAVLEEQDSEENEDSDETRSRSAAPGEKEQVSGENEVSDGTRSAAAMEGQVSGKKEVSDETSSRSAAAMEDQVSDKNQVFDETRSHSAVAVEGKDEVCGYQDDKLGFINGVQVFDEYGILVGEFSHIDDLSIICQPEDCASIF